jgi:molecular chaperone DnaK
VEVAFDIDANGIGNVTATDQATGKEQKITISGSSGLSKEQVDRMVKDAQSHAVEDESRRELIDARNQADALASQLEHTVNESRERVAEVERSRIEAVIARVRKVVQTDDLAAIRRAVDELQHESDGIATTLYQGSARSQGSQAPASSASTGSNVKDAEVVEDAEVVDAEYAETTR